MNRRGGLLALALLTGCVPQPPGPAPPRDATEVRAGFEATWTAVIDDFAERNVPIATIEKVSGIIATSPMRVSRGDAAGWADCGTSGSGLPLLAQSVVYNVLVRGDEERSSIRVTASWSNPDGRFECQTKGVWEEATETRIKQRAERSR